MNHHCLLIRPSYCWWFRNPKQPTWDGAKTLYIMGKNYQPQLVDAGFLNHQTGSFPHFLGGKPWQPRGKIPSSLCRPRHNKASQRFLRSHCPIKALRWGETWKVLEKVLLKGCRKQGRKLGWMDQWWARIPWGYNSPTKKIFIYNVYIYISLVFLDPSFWGLSERPQKYTNDPKSAIFEVVRKVNMSHSQVCLFFLVFCSI